ncbi:MAG: rRNA maturation RNAse YbeY [Myxococcota bacterium]
MHGILHLLGHDHVNGGRQATRMRAEEARVLKAIGRRT